MPRALVQLSVHLPGDPEQQDTAREGQADDGEKLDRDEGEADAQHRGHRNAERNHPMLLLTRQPPPGPPAPAGLLPTRHATDTDKAARGAGPPTPGTHAMGSPGASRRA